MAHESGPRFQTLLDLGLTEYQAKIYLALVQTGAATASELADRSDVPRTRIYATVEQLHEKGLVKILPEKPIRYRPVPIRDYLQRLIGETQERAAELSDLQETYAKMFAVREAAAPPPGGTFEVYRGRQNVREKMLQMWGGAKKSIEFIGMPHAPPRLLGKLYTVARERKADGVQVRLVFPLKTPHMDKVQSAFSDLEVRFALEVPPIDVCTVDGREGILIHRNPDDPDPYEGRDVAIWWDEPAILQSRVGLFEAAWRDALSPDHPGLALVPAAVRSWLELPGVKPRPALLEMARNLGAQLASSIRADTLPGILEELNDVFTETEVASVGKGRGQRVIVRCRYHPITGACPEYDGFCRTLLQTVLQGKLGPDSVEEVTHTQKEGCSVVLK